VHFGMNGGKIDRRPKKTKIDRDSLQRASYRFTFLHPEEMKLPSYGRSPGSCFILLKPFPYCRRKANNTVDCLFVHTYSCGGSSRFSLDSLLRQCYLSP